MTAEPHCADCAARLTAAWAQWKTVSNPRIGLDNPVDFLSTECILVVYILLKGDNMPMARISHTTITNLKLFHGELIEWATKLPVLQDDKLPREKFYEGLSTDQLIALAVHRARIHLAQ